MDGLLWHERSFKDRDEFVLDPELSVMIRRVGQVIFAE